MIYCQCLKRVLYLTKTNTKASKIRCQRTAGIYEQFGKFPHRNDILVRNSTAKEIVFFTQPGLSF
ncbi:MAG: DUF924 family protein [Halanaerobium sp.]